MAISFKKSYKFAFKSSLYISFFVVLSLLVYHNFMQPINYFILIVFPVTLFFFSFFLMQYRVEVFIYKRIKKLYDEVSLLDATSLQNKTVTTDVSTLTNDIRNFAKEKKIEIESLNIREEYRREFLGNISHELKTPLFTVQGYLDTLIEGGAIKDKTLRVKYIERASKGVERLINIVQDLDMISKFEVGDLNIDIEGFDIIAEIQNVFDLLEMKADAKNIILMFDEKYISPIIVYADKDGNIIVGENGLPLFELSGNGDPVTAYIPRMVVLKPTTNGEACTVDESTDTGNYERKGAASFAWLLALPLVWLRRRVR